MYPIHKARIPSLELDWMQHLPKLKSISTDTLWWDMHYHTYFQTRWVPHGYSLWKKGEYHSYVASTVAHKHKSHNFTTRMGK